MIDLQSSKVQEYAALLDQLEPKCEEPRMMLADMSVKTQQLLAEKGVKEINFVILDAVYKAVQAYDTPQKCQSVFVAIVTLVNK